MTDEAPKGDPEATAVRLFGSALQDKVHRDVSKGRTPGSLTWVEQLASEWERKAYQVAAQVADKLPGNVHAPMLTGMVVDVVRGLAAELRERARQRP